MTTHEPDTTSSTPQTPQPPGLPAPPAPVSEAPRPSHYKNPALAAFLSLFPGVGNLYNGLYMRGLSLFLICTSMIVLTTRVPLFGLGIAFFWIFNMIDAYRQAVLINHGYAQDLGINEPPKLDSLGQGGMMAGVLMLAIGAFALADRYFGPIDLDWLIDLWPVFLMAIGAWLIFDTVREKMRKKKEDSDVTDI